MNKWKDKVNFLYECIWICWFCGILWIEIFISTVVGPSSSYNRSRKSSKESREANAARLSEWYYGPSWYHVVKPNVQLSLKRWMRQWFINKSIFFPFTFDGRNFKVNLTVKIRFFVTVLSFSFTDIGFCVFKYL